MTENTDLDPNPYTPPAAELVARSSTSAPDYPVEFVDFWPRVLARLIDCGPKLGAGLFGHMLALQSASSLAARTGTDFRTAWALLTNSRFQWVLLGLLGASAYQVICEAGSGSTLGKFVLDMVVLDERGLPCGPVAAIVRNVLYFLDILIFGSLAAVTMGGSPMKQRVGDKRARTIVVRRRSTRPSSLRSPERFLLILVVAVLCDSLIVASPSVIRSLSL
ncbi:MAG: RDD family protein [Thermoanaerobaculia bacterium]